MLCSSVMFECGNFHSSTYLLNSLTTIIFSNNNTRTQVQDANERDPEKKLWTHSESSEIATAIVSTAQAVWQSLSLGGQKELKVPLSQLMRT